MDGDIVLDTNITADFLAVYFQNNVSTNGVFDARYNLNVNIVKRINEILSEFRFGEGIFEKGIVVASSFAFVEIARQFEEIADNRFSLEQFRAFIDSPPDWFLIETVSVDLFHLFNDVPEKVVFDQNNHVPIEWADAIHIVTTLSRGNQSVLCTTDGRILRIPSLKERFI